jgi:hypothetical protein
MLAVRIHDQGMGEAIGRRGPKTIEHGSPFAAIDSAAEKPHWRILPASLGQSLAGPVFAAVDDDPNRLPKAPCVGNRFEELGTRVVAWNENEMRLQGAAPAPI